MSTALQLTDLPDGEGAGHPESELRLLLEVSRILSGRPAAVALLTVAETLRVTGGFDAVGIARIAGSTAAWQAVDTAKSRPTEAMDLDERLIQASLRDGRPIAAPRSRPAERSIAPWRSSDEGEGAVDVYVPIPGDPVAWGVLVAESGPNRSIDRKDLDLLVLVAERLGSTLGVLDLQHDLEAQREQTRTVANVTYDLSSKLDFPAVVAGLVSHTMRLFGADHGAVWEVDAETATAVRFAVNLSPDYIEAVLTCMPRPTVAQEAMVSRHALVVPGYADDPRAGGLRAAIVQAGIDTVAIAPLLAEGGVVGVLALYHDERREWSDDELRVLEIIGAQAGAAASNVRNYEQMVAWAAQLQSIQQLGSRLTRLTTVADIGRAIANELHELIDFHNVRVFRVRGDVLEPVAWRGEIGEYSDEDVDQLRLTVGKGLTGWVAQHGIAQYVPDAAHDPRVFIIPDTEPDLDESMLLAPMRFEDQVIGVIVLSKLGLDQFHGSDELRLLEIYASLAAQAMVNADATELLRAQSERLVRQVENQRELLSATESILSTLDPLVVMEGIADRLGKLVKVDNLAIERYDATAHTLSPIFASGIHAELFMREEFTDESGVSGWVARYGEAQLVQDQLVDERVLQFESRGRQAGALIVAPLRARDQVTGVLVLERIGVDALFDDDEFELIKLFAGHVSIALQNALAHQAVELRAQTDFLTGLKNHGTFIEFLGLAISRATPFSLLLVDLDDFKSFNDRRGHEAGSQLLVSIGVAISAACREMDGVFRYGGDEFAVILPGTEGVGSVVAAAKVRDAVRRVPAPGSRRRSGVTCSVGVATFPTDKDEMRDLIVAADRACYLAKRLGGDQVATAQMDATTAAAADVAEVDHN